MSQAGPLSEKTVILAPLGRDGEIAAAILHAANFPAETCTNLHDLIGRIGQGAGLAIIADEAILTADLRPLSETLSGQPAWSDFPIILMTKQGGGPERNPAAARLAELLGNVTFLERPFHPTTLVSLVRAAVRSRRRQYEARARLAELSEGERRLQTALTAGQLGSWMLDVEQKALLASKTCKAHFGRSPEQEFSYKDLFSSIHPDDLPRVQDAALTRRMLAFARQQDLQTNSVDLTELITGMGDLLDRSLGPQFDLKLTLAAALPQAEVDSNQIELAILNLVINARDAMPDGGPITITADFPTTIPDSLAPGTYVRVSVADKGIGMNAETIKKAIEPFFSTKEVGKGTGLGLSMVHGLAVQHGGLFELSSQEGLGTVATIWLPASSRAKQEQRFVAAVAEDTESRRGTILVVDDDTLISMATVDMLEDLGHTVIEANSGKQALEILTSGAKIDIMMTDQAMPGMTGMELAERARNLFPNLPILLATGYADLPAGQKFDLPRLSKPYLQDALKTELDKLLLKRASA